ncbi:MAG TPA: hypothetical protein VFY79_01495 [Dehalococcoidia bacterium]|jgi:hypothetical protein|nr:hypothetical protein [Dehalococcoidia bacterium]
MADSYILTRLNSIEAELAAVRRRLQEREQPRNERESLFGILEGEEFTEEEIDAIVARTFRDADGEE